VSAVPSARLDLASAALTLAASAADKRRTRKEPLSRREALREAPWVPTMAESGVDQRAFRAAYADRLVERGIALPSTAELPRPSGPSGRRVTKQITITVDPERLAKYDAAAARSRRNRSDWIRITLDDGAQKKTPALR
jgi:hypothetical protein